MSCASAPANSRAACTGGWGCRLSMVDERLTSFEAKQISREQGHQGDYKRQPVDSQAAELVLQTWLENPVKLTGS